MKTGGYDDKFRPHIPPSPLLTSVNSVVAKVVGFCGSIAKLPSPPNDIVADETVCVGDRDFSAGPRIGGASL